MAGVKVKGVGFSWGICWAGVGLVRVFANFGRAFRVNPSSWEFCFSNKISLLCSASMPARGIELGTHRTSGRHATNELITYFYNVKY